MSAFNPTINAFFEGHTELRKVLLVLGPYKVLLKGSLDPLIIISGGPLTGRACSGGALLQLQFIWLWRARARISNNYNDNIILTSREEACDNYRENVFF